MIINVCDLEVGLYYYRIRFGEYIKVINVDINNGKLIDFLDKGHAYFVSSDSNMDLRPVTDKERKMLLLKGIS